MKIEYPTEEEINMSIAVSIEKAYPNREGLLIYLGRLYRQIGMAFLLHGMWELFLLVIAAYGFGICCYDKLSQTLTGNSHLLIILVSPLVFQSILLLSVLREQEQYTYEVEMTCKYTVYHVLALRMLIVSGFSILLNAIFCTILFWENGMAVLVRMVFLSATAVFAYSLFYVSLLTKSIRLIYQVLLYGAWLLGNVLFRLLLPMVHEYMVWRLPVVLHVFVWFLFAGIMGHKLSQFMYRNCQYNLYMGDSIC